MADKCVGWGRVVGHNFVPRYSYSEPRRVDGWFYDYRDQLAVMDATRSRTYHGDICTRCGLERRTEGQR